MTSDDCGCPTCVKYRPASGEHTAPHPPACPCLTCAYDPRGPIPFPATPPPILTTPAAALDKITRDLNKIRVELDTLTASLTAILAAVKKSRR